ncbi:MAG: DUF2184 domain-containing protein [Burkholderiaceae bacterium]|nr:DUF2184 domain-containing protein [Burkholderiaceae bacterium]
MRFTLNDGLNILVPALAAFREQMVEEKYPEIVFPQFMTVDSSGGTGLTDKIHFSVESASDLDDGLIGDKTTSVDTVAVDFADHRSPIVSWAKGVEYTLRELEICARLGIEVDTQKIRVLRQNADQTLQKVAFMGHGRDKRITGLLNSLLVKPLKGLKGATAAKGWAEMTGEEAAQALIDMFKVILDKTELIAAPDTLAIPMTDFVEVAVKPRHPSGSDTSVLEYVTEKLKAAAGKPVTIRGIPLKYADTAGVGGKKRAIAYINSAQHVLFDVPVTPEMLDAQQKGLLAWQTGMRMDFGGVSFLEPQSAAYFDYDTVPAV